MEQYHKEPISAKHLDETHVTIFKNAKSGPVAVGARYDYALTDEIKEWLEEENMKYWPKITNLDNSYLVFEKQEEAFYFKMVWG